MHAGRATRHFGAVLASMLALLGGCAGGGPPTAAELARIDRGDAALVLLRCTATVDFDAPIAAVPTGSFDRVQLDALVDLDSGADHGGTPRRLGGDAADDGWCWYLLPPGNWVATVRPMQGDPEFEDRAVVRIEVPPGAATVYAGSLHVPLRSAPVLGVLPAYHFDRAGPTVAVESDAARAVLRAHLPDQPAAIDVPMERCDAPLDAAVTAALLPAPAVVRGPLEIEPADVTRVAVADAATPGLFVAAVGAEMIAAGDPLSAFFGTLVGGAGLVAAGGGALVGAAVGGTESRTHDRAAAALADAVRDDWPARRVAEALRDAGVAASIVERDAAAASEERPMLLVDVREIASRVCRGSGRFCWDLSIRVRLHDPATGHAPFDRVYRFTTPESRSGYPSHERRAGFARVLRTESLRHPEGAAHELRSEVDRAAAAVAEAVARDLGRGS